MKRLSRVLVISIASFIPFICKAQQRDFIVVTDYVTADGSVDLSDELQEIIDSNPNHTIYFPDGIYRIDKPILTPASPEKSVALSLSNYAIIKAGPNWSGDEAMIRLGGKDPSRTIATVGSNYFLEGGIIDGSGVAKGISIDSGRETVVRNCSIKHVSVGIHIKRGSNNGSSDADIRDVNIYGNKSVDCIGVLVEGADNTLTNIRMQGAYVGVKLCSGGNSLINIHPLFATDDAAAYQGTCGFWNTSGHNFFYFCYSDEMAIGFREDTTAQGHYVNCFSYWYSNRGVKHTSFQALGQFNAFVFGLSVGMQSHNAVSENVVLDVAEPGGMGCFIQLDISDEDVLTNMEYKKYLK